MNKRGSKERRVVKIMVRGEHEKDSLSWPISWRRKRKREKEKGRKSYVRENKRERRLEGMGRGGGGGREKERVYPFCWLRRCLWDYIRRSTTIRF